MHITDSLYSQTTRKLSASECEKVSGGGGTFHAPPHIPTPRLPHGGPVSGPPGGGGSSGGGLNGGGLQGSGPPLPQPIPGTFQA